MEPSPHYNNPSWNVTAAMEFRTASNNYEPLLAWTIFRNVVADLCIKQCLETRARGEVILEV